MLRRFKHHLPNPAKNGYGIILKGCSLSATRRGFLYLVDTFSVQQIWQTALGEIQIQVSKPNFRTWFEKTEGVAYQNNQFTIGVPNTFVAEYLEKNQRSLIEKTLIGLTRQEVNVNFRVNGWHNQLLPAPTSSAVVPHPQAHSCQLNPRYTFDTFVVSNCNRMAHAASLGVAENPGHTYNPLFIYGGVGLGKTHLLHAIGHAAQSRNTDALYVSAEQFTNEFVRAIRERKTDEFREKYRNAGMLLVDDIQFICGKEQTEESFFHTFNELHNANRQIVVTCDCPPKSIPVMEERLRSRFEWGLTTCIEPPDYETRLAILQAKVESKGTSIAREILDIIARRGQQNIRELEGSLNRVIAYARLLKANITPELAEKALADIASKQPAPSITPTPEYIIKMVADCFGSTVEAVKSNKRDRQTVLARQIAMYLIRQETSYSLEQIGKELGNREPITVSQACKKIEAEVRAGSELKQKILSLQRKMSSINAGTT